jgi:hypothetical protein
VSDLAAALAIHRLYRPLISIRIRCCEAGAFWMQGVDIDRPKLQSHSYPSSIGRFLLSRRLPCTWQVAICALIDDVGVSSRGMLGSRKWILTSDPQALSNLLRDIGTVSQRSIQQGVQSKSRFSCLLYCMAEPCWHYHPITLKAITSPGRGWY